MKLDEIFQQLYESNSLENLVSIKEIKTEEDKQREISNGYNVVFTLDEWEKAYPMIPSDNIYFQKNSDVLYFDRKNYILVHTHLYTKERPSFIENFETSLKNVVQDLYELKKKKDYENLLKTNLSEGSGYSTMYLLNFMLENELPDENLYNAFTGCYSFTDVGVECISEKAWSNLLLCKTEAQKEDTKKRLSKMPDTFTVYRGEGSKSTHYNKAISWTTNINVAYFFASRRGAEKARIISGTVRKEDVVEYITDRNESEVLINCGKVKNISILSCIEFETFMDTIKYDFEDYDDLDNVKNDVAGQIKEIQRLYKQSKNPHAYHEASHTWRVLLLAEYLYHNLVMDKYGFENEDIRYTVMEDMNKLITAITYHDIGRRNDMVDDMHGKLGCEVFKKDKGNDDIIEYLITFHCLDDEIARNYLDEMAKDKGEEYKDRVWKLYCILKDADALDRVRFGMGEDGLDIKYLREELPKRLIPMAYKLQECEL